MEDNAGRESDDSWFGRRRKCSESRRRSGRSEGEEEEQEKQEGEERGGELQRRSGRSRISFCRQQPGLLMTVHMHNTGRDPLWKPELLHWFGEDTITSIFQFALVFVKEVICSVRWTLITHISFSE